MNNRVGLVLGCVGILAFLAYAAALVVAAFSFLETVWGWHWILALIVLVIVIRVAPLLAALAAFFGVWWVWEWHFLAVFAFVMPGLAIGGVLLLGMGFEALVRKLSSSK